MTDEDCATFLGALDAVVAGKDLPKEALEAIRRGAHALRVKGMLVEALASLVDTPAAREAADLPPRCVGTIRCEAQEIADALGALTEARKEPT